ncbi:hypothetical protein HMPREF1557_01287 [Streptococcus sobrinus W1703]|uniref:Uncharacterized protein n=1 Tax=Streptococcus sobrinus W1703 TaxID=1227275 RepID=U2IPW5_9STRE|nr:hypothetical protein HMPREF1557_01287 [Streptococcus sobrinus W1703]
MFGRAVFYTFCHGNYVLSRVSDLRLQSFLITQALISMFDFL